MLLFPDPNRVPEPCIRLLWNMLQPVQKRKQRKFFSPIEYNHGIFAKDYTTKELEELSESEHILKTLFDLHRRKIIGLISKGDEHKVIFGFWRPVIHEQNGVMIVYQKVYRMTERLEIKKLEPIFLIPSVGKGYRIFVDQALVNISEETLKEPNSGLKRVPVSIFAEKEFRNALGTGYFSNFPPPEPLVIKGVTGLGISYECSSLPNFENLRYIYEVYIYLKLFKLERALTARETRSGSDDWNIVHLCKGINLFFPIAEYEEQKQTTLSKKKKRKPKLVDPDPKNTILLLKSFVKYVGLPEESFDGRARIPLIKLREKLDEFSKGRKAPQKLYNDYFRLLTTYGMSSRFNPSYQWWFSDSAWSTYFQILENQFPGGYF